MRAFADGFGAYEGKAQPVFFSLLFEQLLPDWTQGEATPDEAEEACAWL
ncbi:MAG: hypothetical protein ACLR4A_14875 [Christensenellales bacterium]